MPVTEPKSADGSRWQGLRHYTDAAPHSSRPFKAGCSPCRIVRRIRDLCATAFNPIRFLDGIEKEDNTGANEDDRRITFIYNRALFYK
jgi:hypothetical protein